MEFIIFIYDALKDLLISILELYHGFIPDWGVAIILLTLTTRVIMLPLTIKQTKSMAEMKKWQPKLKELQAKFKDDRQKMNEEIMKFYKEHKINPFGGCLPLILQLPIFIALFQILNGFKPVEGQPFLFLIKDLSLSPAEAATQLPTLLTISYFVLIALMLVTNYAQSKMMSADPKQDRIMLFMSVFMAYIAWNFPAGVLLYWVTTNVWQIAQQSISAGRQDEGKEALKNAKK